MQSKHDQIFRLTMTVRCPRLPSTVSTYRCYNSEEIFPSWNSQTQNKVQCPNPAPPATLATNIDTHPQLTPSIYSFNGAKIQNKTCPSYNIPIYPRLNPQLSQDNYYCSPPNSYCVHIEMLKFKTNLAYPGTLNPEQTRTPSLNLRYPGSPSLS